MPILAPKHIDEEDVIRGNEMRIRVYKGVIAELKARMTPETTPAPNAVIRQYRDRISHFRAQNATPDSLDTLNRELYDRQARVVRAQMERELISKATGKRFLKRLKRSETFYTRASVRDHAVRYPWRHPFTAIMVGFESALRAINPLKPKPQMEAELRKLSVDVEEAAIIFLSDRTADSDKLVARAARLLLEEHEVALATAQSRLENNQGTMSLMRQAMNPRMRTRTPRERELLVKYVPEVEAEGLRLELELIQKMREEGTISRAVAADLREEVYVMQMDL